MKNILFAIILLTGFSATSCTKPAENTCIDKSKINREGICTQEYNPVCGCDRKTYGNECEARNAGLTNWKPGECGSKEQ